MSTITKIIARLRERYGVTTPPPPPTTAPPKVDEPPQKFMDYSFEAQPYGVFPKAPAFGAIFPAFPVTEVIQYFGVPPKVLFKSVPVKWDMEDIRLDDGPIPYETMRQLMVARCLQRLEDQLWRPRG